VIFIGPEDYANEIIEHVFNPGHEIQSAHMVNPKKSLQIRLAILIVDDRFYLGYSLGRLEWPICLIALSLLVKYSLS